MNIRKFFSFLLPRPIRLDIREIENKFAGLQGKVFELVIPIIHIQNGMLIDARKKTIGFQKSCAPYNFTILHFENDKLFYGLNNRRGLSGIKLLVKTKALTRDDKNQTVKTLELTVLKAQKI